MNQEVKVILEQRIRLSRIEDLPAYARNTRTHSAAQVAELMASLLEFGWTRPILADGDGIVAGHGTALAAAKIYAQGKTIRLPGGEQIPAGMVPWIDVSGWSSEQRRAYIIADNRLALNAGWDKDLLAIELKDLQEIDFDLGLLGFGADEISALLAGQATAGNTDPDATPEPPAEPVSRMGDVWLMGKHRIVCGSSTDADDVAKCLNGATPHLMVTDPPYGIEYDADWRNNAFRADGSPVGGRAVGKVLNDDRADWREAWALFPGGVAYVWHAGVRSHEVAESLAACGFKLYAQVIWAKSNMVIGRGHYHPKHEPCWYAVRKGATGHWQGDRKQTTLWEIDKPRKSETGHSTQKPIECMKRPIENNSAAGQAVYEPFSGSGTTIIACEMTARVCHAIELNPAYVDVAVKRWQDFAGGGGDARGRRAQLRRDRGGREVAR